jgi:dienelactone hydrolase
MDQKKIYLYPPINHMMKTIACLAIALLSIGAIKAKAQDLKPVQYTDGQQKLNGFVTANAGQKLPGVLVLPAWKGIDQEARTAAQNLEKQGYIAFIADIYGEGNYPTDAASAGKLSGSYKTNYQAYQHRIELALEQLKKAGATKVAVIGYCFGGAGTLEVARAGFPVTGIVSIHGALAKDSTRPNGPINIKMLIENAAEDPGVKPEVMAKFTKELNDGRADWQVITYAYCKHTFTDPASPDYNAEMATRAWQHTTLFLQELFK